jgi:hypothetical protein
MLVSIILISVACKKNETPLNINYPAAYVVNGEDASISVNKTESDNDRIRDYRINGRLVQV